MGRVAFWHVEPQPLSEAEIRETYIQPAAAHYVGRAVVESGAMSEERIVDGETGFSTFAESVDARAVDAVYREAGGMDEARKQGPSRAQAHVAAESERIRPLKAAELSSQQRNALVDDLVATVNNHARVLGEMRRKAEALDRTCVENAMRVDRALDRHDGILSAVDTRMTRFVGRTFWQRLRWLVTGR